MTTGNVFSMPAAEGERWTDEAVKGWVGKEVKYDTLPVGRIIRAWTELDGRMLMFEMVFDAPSDD